MLKSQLTQALKSKALSLGFDFVGISKVEPLHEEAKYLERWLNSQHHGDMSWMENYFDKRVNPKLLMPGSKSIISVALNYFPEKEQVSNTYFISKYAYGKDYHKVIKKKLFKLIEWMEQKIGEINARAFVDSAPVMDKAWAKRSGLGWIGKNTNLINKNAGSFFLLGEIICDVVFDYDGSVKDYCGTCTKCIDACPTDALIAPYEIDGSKCISYLTIELKNNIPEEFTNKLNDWVFGCDICQDVCPWNRFKSPSLIQEFLPHPNLLEFNKDDWDKLNEDTFNEIFKGSAVKRTKYKGLMRNIEFVKKSP